MIRKLLSDSRYSVVVVFAVVLVTLIYQFSTGASLVYFLPDYPVTMSANDAAGATLNLQSGPYSGFDKCFFYGSCFAMANGVNLSFVEPLLLVILYFFAFVAGREDTLRRKIRGGLIVAALYVIVLKLQGLGWFFRCNEFCGIEYLFLWIPLVVLYFTSAALGFVGKNPKQTTSESR